MIAWDELTHFTEEQFTYLLSRLRSESESNSYTIASMNPDPDSWVLKWVQHYLDEEGYFNEDMAGVITYFVMVEGSPIFAETREELIEQYPQQCYDTNPRTGEEVFIPPKSFTFLGSTIYDNPILIKTNPNYLAELKSLPEVEMMRLLKGNWYARPKGSNHFDRNWLHKLDEPPRNGLVCRAWDKACSEPSELERFPDFTASIKMMKTREGNYVILGDYCPENGEEKFRGRFRKTSGTRDKIIGQQAEADGTECRVVLPVDVGAAGKTEYQESVKKLVSLGMIVKPDPMPTNKSKLTKFQPFSSAAENGLVYIVESSFPDLHTLNEFYKELEAFNGERSSRQRKDDWADCTASAFNFLAKERVLKLPVRNQNHVSTHASEVLRSQTNNSVKDVISNINTVPEGVN